MVEPAGFIYRVTNRVNGRVYIGQTRRSVSYRWSVHKSEAGRRAKCYFHKAIAKNGPEAFFVEMVDVAASSAELDALEQQWIAREHSHLPGVGYNLTLGGRNAVRTDRARLNMGLAQRGKRASLETRLKMSAVRKGRKQTPQHLANRSAAQRGKRPSEACLRAVAEANKRRILTPETRAKLSAAAQKANQVRWARA